MAEKFSGRINGKEFTDISEFFNEVSRIRETGTEDGVLSMGFEFEKTNDGTPKIEKALGHRFRFDGNSIEEIREFVKDKDKRDRFLREVFGIDPKKVDLDINKKKDIDGPMKPAYQQEEKKQEQKPALLVPVAEKFNNEDNFREAWRIFRDKFEVKDLNEAAVNVLYGLLSEKIQPVYREIMDLQAKYKSYDLEGKSTLINIDRLQKDWMNIPLLDVSNGEKHSKADDIFNQINTNRANYSRIQEKLEKLRKRLDLLHTVKQAYEELIDELA